jgi:hypothetical protein
MEPITPIEPDGVFTGLRWGAILFGAFVDIAATILTSTLLLAAVEPAVLSQDDAVAREAISRMNTSHVYVLGSIALGALCTVLGAFLGARSAGRLHVRHGGWIAVTSALLGMLMLLVDPSAAADPSTAVPLWAEALGWLLILPAGVAGGALAGALHPRARR